MVDVIRFQEIEIVVQSAGFYRKEASVTQSTIDIYRVTLRHHDIQMSVTIRIQRENKT